MCVCVCVCVHSVCIINMMCVGVPISPYEVYYIYTIGVDECGVCVM